MKLSHSSLRWIARFLLGLLLFAQGMLAANACDVLGGNITQVFANVAADSAPCHDEDSSNANVCLDHCTQGDRISGHQVTPVFLPPSAVIVLPALAAPSNNLPQTSVPRLALNTGPPLAIRFCSFQI